jgi:hypothetical protein
MKPARREWALIAAFILYMIFLYSQFSFMIGADAGPQKISQVNVASTAGMILGALLLPLLLPFGDLRERRQTGGLQTNGSRPFRYTLRLVIVAAFFLPQIIVRLLGPQAWQTSPFNFRFMSIGNGIVSTLMFGCIFTLAGKYRVFWASLASSMGFFWYNLALGPGRELLLPYMFALAGITLTAAGVLLLVFLAGAGVPAGLPIKNHAVENRAAAESRDFQDESPHAGRGNLLLCIYPILAALIIFWTNSLTDKLFLQTNNINFTPGLHLTSLVQIVTVPVFGFLASVRWRRFLKEYIRLGAFLFLLSPSLLLLSHSQMLFLILHTLSIVVIRMMIVIFPFAIIDLYWQKTRGGY